ncbi:MAG: type II toxin-antitoxin system HicA family toxin [bacterium]
MQISGKDIIKLFKKAGWNKLRQKGSHVIMGKGNKRISIPLHNELNKGLEHRLRKVLKED